MALNRPPALGCCDEGDQAIQQSLEEVSGSQVSTDTFSARLLRCGTLFFLHLGVFHFTINFRDIPTLAYSARLHWSLKAARTVLLQESTQLSMRNPCIRGLSEHNGNFILASARFLALEMLGDAENCLLLN